MVVFALIGCTELTAHRMDDPSRDVWQKPQGVVEKLSIAPGSRVAHEEGWRRLLTWHLAKAVGARGVMAYAVEIDEQAIT